MEQPGREEGGVRLNYHTTPELSKAIRQITTLRDNAAKEAERLDEELAHQDEVLKDLVEERGRTWESLKAAQVEVRGLAQAVQRLEAS